HAARGGRLRRSARRAGRSEDAILKPPFPAPPPSAAPQIDVQLHAGAALRDFAFDEHAPAAWAEQLAWLRVCQAGLKHEPYLLVAVEAGRLRGVASLARVRSRLFGKFLVSLPYINSSGIFA